MALAAIEGDLTIVELAKRFDVHPNQIAQWKSQLLDNATSAFDGGRARSEAPDLKALHAKIGQQASEIDFLESALGREGDARTKRCSMHGTIYRSRAKRNS